jgi:hypothetical protein
LEATTGILLLDAFLVLSVSEISETLPPFVALNVGLVCLPSFFGDGVVANISNEDLEVCLIGGTLVHVITVSASSSTGWDTGLELRRADAFEIRALGDVVLIVRPNLFLGLSRVGTFKLVTLSLAGLHCGESRSRFVLNWGVRHVRSTIFLRGLAHTPSSCFDDTLFIETMRCRLVGLFVRLPVETV